MERRKDIDLYRGLGILLVVLGHVSYLSPYWFKVIYSFHMPAFFILSGYLFNAKNLGMDFYSFIKYRFFRLVIPAWIIGLICGIPYLIMLLSNHISASDFVTKLFGTLTGATKVDRNFFVTPIWFLYCLFILEVIFYLINTITQNRYMIAIIAIIVFTVGKNVELTSVFNINIAFISIPYFVVGYLLREVNIPRVKFIALCAIIVVFLMPLVSPQGVDFSSMQIGDGIWILVNGITAITGTYLLYFFAGYIRSDIIAWLGTNTIIILGFNYYINAIAKTMLKIIHMDRFIILSFIIQILLFSMLIKLISRSPRLDSIINGKFYSASKETK